MDLTAALHGFTDKPLLGATRDLFKKTLGIPLSPLADSPITAERFFGKNYNDKRHSDVNAVYLGGRITDDSFGLFENDAADIEVLEAELKDKEDYPGLFIFAVDLGDKQLNRTELSTLTRDVNRLFPTPVIVVFKHTLSSKLVLSFGVADRRQHKKDKSKHVLGKVSIIRDIDPLNPHRGHQGLLARFAFKGLKTAEGKPVTNFRSFHSAIAEIFNVELLNKQFYRELSNWYFWAMQNCHFPYLDPDTDKYDLFKDEEKVREHDAKNLIRLLTRILFVWFIKEKGLVPDSFFETNCLKKELLKDFDPNSRETNYYKAILQNLFFATLNQTHGKREFRKQGQHQNTTTLLRYEERLKSPEKFIEIVEDTTPFLNGGLFDCLDYPHSTKKGPQGGAVIVYEDGFSDRKDNPLNVPDFLFFGSSQEVDLSDNYGDKKRKKEKARGLIHILNGYKFTIEENSPVEQEIALDPELLGQVFENLLASYNPETKTTARKQTGSFYTPRPIVDYMVDESLKSYLLKTIIKASDTPDSEKEAVSEKLDDLFAYHEEPNPFNKEQTEQLIRAIDNCTILDPACGSGAFPMGALQKLVYVLSKLDPRDELWEKRQLSKVDKLIKAAQDIEDSSFRERAIEDAEAQRSDIEEAFAKNELGYGRKLYLIENCLYGLDIQPIATQISKLRFFISLIVDQTVDRKRENFGIRPLPNLETKFVTADTLIRIEKPKTQGELSELTKVPELQKQLKQVRHDLFSAKKPDTKRRHRKRDEELRVDIAEELKQNGWSDDDANKLASWDPYDQNASAPYFDPEWMFGLTGFDIVIGNPPYIQIQTFPKKQKDTWVKQGFDTYTATADIYCLFYERGAQLLKDGGSLVYITSNKYYRSGYGRKLRDFLAKEFTLHKMLDFGDAPVFEAIAYASIMVGFRKPVPKGHNLKAYTWQRAEKIEQVSSTMEQKAFHVDQSNFTPDGWQLERPDVFALLQKLKSKGTPLSEYVDERFYYGIKTGLNDAFVVNQVTRDRLIKEDAKSEDVLKPFLRGRDLKRWKATWAGYYLIKIESSQNKKHPWSDLKGKEAEDIFHKTYPAIYRWFQALKTQTDKNGKSLWDRLLTRADQGKFYWELRACAYWEEFNQDQIGWGNLATKPQFSTIEPRFISCAPAVVAITREKWIPCILNSTTCEYLISMAGAERQNGFYEFKPMYVGPLPIPKVNKEDKKELSVLMQKAQESEGNELAMIEGKINKIVYRLYELTREEIALIESSISKK